MRLKLLGISIFFIMYQSHAAQAETTVLETIQLQAQAVEEANVVKKIKFRRQLL